jgi:hypothetical protein
VHCSLKVLEAVCFIAHEIYSDLQQSPGHVKPAHGDFSRCRCSFPQACLPRLRSFTIAEWRGLHDTVHSWRDAGEGKHNVHVSLSYSPPPKHVIADDRITGFLQNWQDAPKPNMGNISLCVRVRTVINVFDNSHSQDRSPVESGPFSR